MEAAVTGDPIDCAAALAYGLVNATCEPGDALRTARQLAGRITANAPLAVRESRALVLGYTYADDAAGWRRSKEATAAVMGSHDANEGVAAFLEKRAPLWTGR
jgi:enoyl-CoA hydratase